MPDVGIDFTVNVFELVDAVEGSTRVEDGDCSIDVKVVRVKKPYPISTITQNKRATIICESPSLTPVGKLTQLLKALRAIDKPQLMLPRQLVILPLEGDPFCKVRPGYVDLLHNIPCFRFHQRMLALPSWPCFPGACLDKNQPAEYMRLVVRPGIDYFIAILRDTILFPLSPEECLQQPPSGNPSSEEKEDHNDRLIRLTIIFDTKREIVMLTAMKAF